MKQAEFKVIDYAYSYGQLSGLLISLEFGSDLNYILKQYHAIDSKIKQQQRDNLDSFCFNKGSK
jgi:hypothetical protein